MEHNIASLIPNVTNIMVRWKFSGSEDPLSERMADIPLEDVVKLEVVAEKLAYGVWQEKWRLHFRKVDGLPLDEMLEYRIWMVRTGQAGIYLGAGEFISENSNVVLLEGEKAVL